jgi:hypothetical protein
VSELVSKGLAPEQQFEMRHRYSAMAGGLEKALACLSNRKATIDRNLLERDYSQWHRLIIDFDGEISVAGTGAITPNVDFEGRTIQVLHDPFSEGQYLYFCVVSHNSGGAFVFTWWNGHSAISRFVDSLQSLSNAELPHVCAQVIFAYCENAYFSEKWWSSIHKLVRQSITELASNSNPGYSRLVFLKDNVVPWRITNVTRE